MKLGNTDISMQAVKAILGETTGSLKELCESNKINRWSKFSPIRPNGNVPSFVTVGIPTGPWNTRVWEASYTQSYKLGDFRNYDHNAPLACEAIFPTEIYNNTLCTFSLKINDEAAFDSVYKRHGKFFGVAFRRVGDINFKWATNHVSGNPIVSVNLGGLFKAGDQIETCVFYATNRKAITEPGVESYFWSVRCEESMQWIKTYTVKLTDNLDKYRDLAIDMLPLNGNWTSSGCNFGRIELRVNVSGVDAYHQYRIELMDPSGRYYNTYDMPSKIYTAKGDRTSLITLNDFGITFFDERINFVKINIIDIMNDYNIVETHLIHKWM